MASSKISDNHIGKTSSSQTTANNYNVTPLFFQQTLDSAASEINDSLCFDEADSVDIDGSLESFRSNGENTFRDTKVDGTKANEIMHVQSLTSITNHPKKESVFKKAMNSVKQKVTGTGVPKFKPMTEA